MTIIVTGAKDGARRPPGAHERKEPTHLLAAVATGADAPNGGGAELPQHRGSAAAAGPGRGRDATAARGPA